MSDITPYLIDNENADGHVLRPLPRDNKHFSENWLQELLFKHPSIIPIEQLDEAYSPMISIGLEIANIDNLFVSPTGALSIIETKLWRNPEGHRTVVAQILDYAQTLSNWDYPRLDQEVKNFTKRRFGVEQSIFELVRKSSSVELDEIEFQQKVHETLSSGRFALLIVGDKVHPAATQLVDIIQSAPHLQFSLGFVELQCFRFTDDDWPLLVVPYFVEKTKEVTRAVVKIVYEEKKPEVQIDSMEEKKIGAGKTSKAEFLATLPSSMRDVFETHIERWMASEHTIYWGQVGFSLRLNWKGKLTTIFEAYPDNASIFTSKLVNKYFLPESPFDRYKASLIESEIFGSEFAKGKRYIRYDRMNEGDIELLLDETDKLIDALHETGRQDS